MNLERTLAQGHTPRVVGFDDAPFARKAGVRVNVAGVICWGTRFEAMLWTAVRRDGARATEVITKCLLDSRFHAQVHLVLLDGIAFGGFNVVDLPALSKALDRPCVSVMRKAPDMTAIEAALSKLPRAAQRLATMRNAGEVHTRGRFVFQVQGASADVIERALTVLTDRGNVPEALRLAHHIGAAVCTGSSGRRA